MQKNVSAYASFSPEDILKPLKIQRRKVQNFDVKISIMYCGVCHTDIHYWKNDWGITSYPLVPGHEIIGKVLNTGKNVKKFKKGDIVGVGVLIDSCQKCYSCKSSLEQYCNEGAVFTYNAPDAILGGRTFGGYSETIIVNEKFVLKIPVNLDIKSVAPLLCAGITTYSPLKKWKIGKNDKVGIIGMGGLGHIAIKFAKAMEAQVTVITSSKKKINDAKNLGASEVILSKDNIAMQKNHNSFDFLLNTIPNSHDLNIYLSLLKIDKTMVIVGAIEPFKNVNIRNLIFGRKSISGSLIGGIKETQDMLNFCAKNNIVCDVEIIDINQINKAFQRIIKSDVKYRFVIDMKSIKK